MPRPARNRSERQRVTIRDVAQAAGVSVGAASTALRNAKSNVVLSAATRARIARVAKELNYRPNAAARAIAGRELRTIGLLTTEHCMGGTYYHTVLRGIAAAVERAGYSLLLKSVPHQLSMADANLFSEQLTDGVLIPVEAEERVRTAVRSCGMPCVWINTGVGEPTNCIDSDEEQGFLLGIGHLYGLGHRRIAYMHHGTGEVSPTSKARERAYLHAMRAHGLEPWPTYDRYMSIEDHIGVLLEMHPRPTALMCYTDYVGLIALHELMRRGLRVPDDISILGNEGAAIHDLTYVKLTSVKAACWEMGATAVEMLLEQITTGAPVPSRKLPQTLDLRNSIAPPRDA